MIKRTTPPKIKYVTNTKIVKKEVTKEKENLYSVLSKLPAILTITYIIGSILSLVYNSVYLSYFKIDFTNYINITDVLLTILNFKTWELVILLIIILLFLITSYVDLAQIRPATKDNFRVFMNIVSFVFGVTILSIFLIEGKVNRIVKPNKGIIIQSLVYKEDKVNVIYDVKMIGSTSNYIFLYNNNSKTSMVLTKANIVNIKYDVQEIKSVPYYLDKLIPGFSKK